MHTSQDTRARVLSAIRDVIRRNADTVITPAVKLEPDLTDEPQQPVGDDLALRRTFTPPIVMQDDPRRY